MRTWFLIAAAVAPGAALQAEAQVDPASPQRVWVRTTDAYGKLDSGIKGTLQRSSGDTLFINTESGGLVPVPPSSERRLFVSQGRRSRSGLGAGIGAGTGLLAGLLVSAAAGGESAADPLILPEKGAAVGAIGGAAIGLAIGAAIRREKWEEVPEHRLRVSIRPARHRGFSVQLSYPLPRS